MFVTELGICAETSLEHELNASLPMFATPAPKVAFVSAEQPLKADAPRSATVPGIPTEVS